MTSARAAVVGCLVVTLGASAARAQDADALIEQGVELRTAGQDEAALRVFRQAWETQRSPRALAQVALAEQALGRWVEAEAHLAAALAERDHRWIRRNRRALEDSLGEIRGHVGRLEIQGTPPGAEVLIGATVVGRLPATLRVATGPVTFTVRAEAHASVTRTVEVARAPLRETVALASLDAPTAAATPAVSAAVAAQAGPAALAVRPPGAPARHVPARRYVGYAVLGAGAAALVVSGVFFGLNASANGGATDATPTSAEPYGAWARFQASENFDRDRSGAEVCDLARQRSGADAAQVQDLCSQLSSSATITLAAGIAGGVLAATGLVLAVTARSTPAAAPRWSVAPWVAPGVGGAVVGGAF